MKNKKLFAILTLVCFMMTLMPVAAFAAVDDQQSYVLTVKDNPTIKVNGNAKILFDLEGDSATTVYVWFLKDSANVPANSVEAVTAGVKDHAAAPNTANIFAINAKDLAEYEFKFTDPGEYKVRASLDRPNDSTAAKAISGVGLPLQTVSTQNVITVKEDAAKTSNYVMVDVSSDQTLGGNTFVDNAKATLAGVTANTATVKTVKLQLLDKQDGDPVKGATVKISAGSANVVVSKESATTNALGQFSFDISTLRQGEYKVYVSVGQYEMTINVGADSTQASSIVLETTPKVPTALDDDYTTKGLQGKIGFRIYDAAGSEVKSAAPGGIDGATCLPEDQEDENYEHFVALVSKPAASSLESKNFYLKYASDEYGWSIYMDETFDEEGTYEFRVVLDNGAYKTVSIEVKEMGTPVGIVITYNTDAVELGSSIVPKAINWIDANNVTKAIDSSVDVAVSGYAVASVATDRYTYVGYDANDKEVPGSTVTTTSATAPATGSGINAYKQVNHSYLPTITVKDDEKYVGSEIVVTCVDERYNLVASKTLKVADEATELAFNTKTGEVNINNKIVAQVVDKDGASVTPTGIIDGTASVVVLDKPEGAKVSATVGSYNLAKGQFDINLTSDKIGNVTIQAVLKCNKYDANQKNVVKYYSGTQIFAIGNGSVGDVVVMSIGSHEVIVNDKKATIDAAPMIQNDRTFVPFRALAEAFGAEVAYDEATQAVTAKLNGVEVVMTIGSATYTVNGAEKTADVAPFINGSRTMVPVRFAAEAFGIKVIPTYNPDGTTADILFNL